LASQSYLKKPQQKPVFFAEIGVGGRETGFLAASLFFYQDLGKKPGFWVRGTKPDSSQHLCFFDNSFAIHPLPIAKSIIDLLFIRCPLPN
jgi:hypothetical protein